MTGDKSPFPEEAIRDWLEALQSKAESPEVIALQRQLLDLLYRAARQLPEVQALVRAARKVCDELLDEAMVEADLLADADWTALHSLEDALEPFKD